MIVPIRDQIMMVNEEGKEKTDGGVYLPEGARGLNTDQAKEVIGVGGDVTQVKVGDIIFFNSVAGKILSFGSESYLLIAEKEVYAKKER